MKKGFDEYDDEFELENVSSSKRNVKSNKHVKKSINITKSAFKKEYLEFIKSLENKLSL